LYSLCLGCTKIGPHCLNKEWYFSLPLLIVNHESNRMELDISMSILKTNEANNFGHRPDLSQVWNSKSSLKIGQLRFLH
jgi:hypothetical protein